MNIPIEAGSHMPEKNTPVSSWLAKRVKFLSAGLAILVLAALAAAYYFYQQSVQLQSRTFQDLMQSEVDMIVEQVGELIVLPEGEQPTIATVTDPEKLKDQPFFANAKKGDRVLIYANAKKAILYDPVDNKIIEVAPINIGNPAPPQPAPPQR
jgi:hypothetical protein